MRVYAIEVNITYTDERDKEGEGRQSKLVELMSKTLSDRATLDLTPHMAKVMTYTLVEQLKDMQWEDRKG